MSADSTTNQVSTMRAGVGDAGGVGEIHWYVGIVNNNTEKSTSEKLLRMGVEAYVPIQREEKVWKNGRRAIIDRVVIPSIVFVHCSDARRKEILNWSIVNRFMVNKAGGKSGALSKPLAIIPDVQMENLKFMVGRSESPVVISEKPFRKGDIVKVIKGNLMGLEGEVMDLSNDQTELVVTLEFFGCARLKIDRKNVEIINS